jgi:hypothetical protein
MYWLNEKIKESERKKRTKQVLDITNRLGIKLQSLGIKKKSVMMAAADLGDIYQYAKDIQQIVDLILELPSSEWDKLETAFVSLRVILGEMKEHSAHARLPLEYMADYCEKHSSAENKE